MNSNYATSILDALQAKAEKIYWVYDRKTDVYTYHLRAVSLDVTIGRGYKITVIANGNALPEDLLQLNTSSTFTQRMFIHSKVEKAHRNRASLAIDEMISYLDGLEEQKIIAPRLANPADSKPTKGNTGTVRFSIALLFAFIAGYLFAVLVRNV